MVHTGMRTLVPMVVAIANHYHGVAAFGLGPQGTCHHAAICSRLCLGACYALCNGRQQLQYNQRATCSSFYCNNDLQSSGVYLLQSAYPPIIAEVSTHKTWLTRCASGTWDVLP